MNNYLFTDSRGKKILAIKKIGGEMPGSTSIEVAKALGKGVISWLQVGGENNKLKK